MNRMLMTALFAAAVLLIKAPLPSAAAMELSSPALKNGGAIPSQYAPGLMPFSRQ